MSTQIEDLLKDVEFIRKVRDLVKDQLAPDFGIFDYLRTDEYGLSRCIADLLDPSGKRGKHGQGSVFLERFLVHIGVPDDDVSNCQVVREKQANGQRRIDIFLELSGWVIGIENKPWANCQDNQLSDYAKYLDEYAKSKGKKWLLVFISNREPDPNCISEDELKGYREERQFFQCSFWDVIEWLRDCACKSRSYVVRVVIEELIKFIRKYINGEVDMSDEKKIAEAVLKKPETLASAFQICKAMDSIKMELLENLCRDLEKRIGKCNLIHSFDKTWKKWTGFSIQFSDADCSQRLVLRFEFSRTGLNGLFWGIRRNDEKYYDRSIWEQVNKLMNDEIYDGKYDERWPWSADPVDHEFDTGMKDWGTSEIPWTMIMNGEMAHKIIDLACRVRSAFEKHNQLHLLC